MRLDAPEYLLVSVAAIAWIVAWQRRRATGLPPFAALACAVLLSIASLALSVVLAGPHTYDDKPAPLDVSVLVDGSASMDDGALDHARDWTRRLVALAPAVSQPRVGVFSGTVAWRKGADDLGRPAADLERTDIGRAVSFALTTPASGGTRRLVVVTDGNDTSGEAREAVRTAANSGAVVHFVSAPAVQTPEVWIQSLEAPRSVMRGRPFSVSARLGGTRPGPVRCTLVSEPAGLVARTVDVESRPAGNEVRFPDLEVPPALKDRFEVRVECRPAQPGLDTYAGNNALSALVEVSGATRIACVDDPGNQCRALARMLGESADVAENPIADAVRPPEPGSRPTDLIVIGNQQGPAVEAQHAGLLDAVRRGTGLLFLGGKLALSLADLAGTPIEQDLLPVFLAKLEDPSRPARAVLMVIDRSASMSGRKIELAREAAIASARALPPDTLLGVVAFDNQPYVVLKPTPVGDAERATSVIATIGPAGGTNILRALTTARDLMLPLRASQKAVVLLTDGSSNPANVVETADALGRANVQVSTIAIGNEPDRALLSRVAEASGGRHYWARTAEAVPRLLLAEVTSGDESAIVPGPRRIVPSPGVGSAAGTGAARLFSGIDPALLPAVGGYVMTSWRPDTTRLATSDRQHPIVATRAVGAGLVGVFTPGLEPDWALKLSTAPEGARLMGNLVATLVREGTQIRVDARIAVVSGFVELTADATDADGRPVDGATLTAKVEGPDGKAHDVRLDPLGLGRYKASFANPWARPDAPEAGVGSYRVTVTGTSDGRDLLPAIGFASHSFPAEYARFGPDRAALELLAKEGRGRLDPSPEDVLADAGTVPVRRSLVPPFALAGLAAFLAALWARRLDRLPRLRRHA